MKEFKGTKGPLERKYVSGICIGIGTVGDYAEMTANSILPDIDDTDKQYKANMERLNADMQLYSCAPEMFQALIKCHEILFAQATRGNYPPELMQENGGCGLSFISDLIKKATTI